MHMCLKTIVFGSTGVCFWAPGSILKVVFGPGAHQVGSNPIKMLMSFFRFGFEINLIMTTLKLL